MNVCMYVYVYIDDDEDDEFETQPFVPTTFGARDAIYGAKMGKGDFGVKYLKDLLKSRLGCIPHVILCIFFFN